MASVNSAVQRARASLSTRDAQASPRALTDSDAELLQRYVSAFERYDVDALTTLLHQDAALSMPPITLWLQGPETIRAWMLGRGSGCRGSRLLPVSACGGPAFAQYRPDSAGGYKPWALIVLEIDAGRIRHINSFLDTATLFPLFGVPAELPPA